MAGRKGAAAFALVAALVLSAACTTANTSVSRTPTAAARQAKPAASTPSSASSSSQTTAAAAQRNGSSQPAVAITGDETPPQVVKQVTPSVVKVSTQGSQAGFFGQVQQQGTGTGIILDTQGHILTNNHVVTLDSSQVANNIQVVLYDGTTLPATVVGRDPNSDLAVLQIHAANLKPLSFAPAGSVEVGEPVLAIGYALNLLGTPTVTTGVVSALDRQLPEGNGVTISNSIQTDAPINPGNSGGPLLNLKGQIVGINTAGAGGSSQGIFFAISSELAQPIAKQLIAKGQIQRGFIGILTESLTPDAARAKHFPVSSGVLIASVQPNTPADRAGLKANDIIVKLGSAEIQNTGDLEQVLAQDPPGTKVTITYYRGSQKQTVDLTLGTRPDSVGG